MADPQDQPNSESDGASASPDKKPPAKAVKKTAKAPAKKAPAKSPEPAPRNQPARPAEPAAGVQQRIETNGQLAAAKDAAAQAKSTVEGANNPVSPAVAAPAASQSPVPLIIALTLSLLAILLIRQLRRR